MISERIETLRKYAIAKKCRLWAVSSVAPCDGIMYHAGDGNPSPFEMVKVEVRNNSKDMQPTIKIAKTEIDEVISSAKSLNLQTVLIVNWAGDINWLNLTEIETDGESLFPEATIKSHDGSGEVRVYCIDTLFFRTVDAQEYQVI